MTRLKKEAIKKLGAYYDRERDDIKAYYNENPEKDTYNSRELELDRNTEEYGQAYDDLMSARNFSWCVRLVGA